MKIYRGKRTVEVSVEVTVNGLPLPLEPSQKLWNHSPTGFEWGYLGSGPAQLALAILLDHAGEVVAWENYQRFKEVFVANWGNEWQITGEEIDTWLESEAEAEFAGA